jgi:iron complex transport system ATP-binding protein
MLIAQAVSMRLGKRPLLEAISLEVRPGEVLAVLGPNGAGKSTLLKILSGETAPSSGYVELEGKKLDRWSLKESAKILAVLPQNPSLHFDFAATDVVALGRSPHEWVANPIIVRSALEASGVHHLANRPYTQLSGGERQRVQFARVLAQIWEPPVTGSRYLLLDEPVSSLDIAYQHSILSTARQFAAQGTGVLAILHDLNLASQYADRLAILTGGRLDMVGTAQEVLTPQRIAATFKIQVQVLSHPSLPCPLIVST